MANKKHNYTMTRKKTKIVGQQEFVNTKTGEIETMNIISVEERDCNFTKLWLFNVTSAIDRFGSQKLRVLGYIADNIDKQNQIIGSYQKIADELDMSKTTVADTFKILLEEDIIRQVQRGVYVLNPNVAYKGGRTDRLNVLYQYSELKKGD